jgi:integrase
MDYSLYLIVCVAAPIVVFGCVMTKVGASSQVPVRRRARGSISRLPSGSLRVRVYVGIDPVSRRQRCLSETVKPGPTAAAQAEEVCRRLVERVQRSRCLRTDATLNELLDQHLGLLHCSEHTRESYEYTAARHIRPVLGYLRLSAVKPEQLDELYADLLRCREHCSLRAKPGHMCRPLGLATVRKIHYLLGSAFRRAVRWGWIDRNPTHRATAPPPSFPEPLPPTPAEAARILAEAWRDPDLGPLVWVAMATGARRGELCALRWRHVDTVDGVMVIRLAIAQARRGLWEKDTKFHQRRHVALDPVTCTILNTYHQQRRQRAAVAGVVLSEDGFVFSPQAGSLTCWSPQELSRQYRCLVDRLGIRTSLHKLRHYSATELIRAGVDVRTVAGRLGHSGAGTTLTYYAAWVQEADQRACRILMERLPLPTPPLGEMAPSRPTRPLSPYQVITAELRTAILNGTQPAGATLPTVKQLNAHHHVAASTAHRAIATLAAENLVTVSRGRRTIVTAASAPPTIGQEST